jgi:hypothetical protein
MNTVLKISTIFSSLNPSARIILASSALKQPYIDQKSIFWPIDPGDDWRGDSNSWDSLIEFAEAHFFKEGVCG